MEAPPSGKPEKPSIERLPTRSEPLFHTGALDQSLIESGGLQSRPRKLWQVAVLLAYLLETGGLPACGQRKSSATRGPSVSCSKVMDINRTDRRRNPV